VVIVSWGFRAHTVIAARGLCAHIFAITQGLWARVLVVARRPCGRLVMVVGGTLAMSSSLEPTVASLSSLWGHCAHIFILAHGFCGRVVAVQGFCGNLARRQ